MPGHQPASRNPPITTYFKVRLIAESRHKEGDNVYFSRKNISLAGWRANFAPYAAIPLRLMVGCGFVAHGFAKWHRGAETFAEILHALGVPYPHLMAWLTIVTEILSGIGNGFTKGNNNQSNLWYQGGVVFRF